MRNTLRLASFIVLACVSLFLMFAAVSAGEQIEIPASSAKALEYHNASNWFWGLNQVVGLALPLLLLVTGWGAHLYELALRISRQHRVVSLAFFAAIIFLLDRLVRLPIRFLWDRAYDDASGEIGRAHV